MTNAVTRTVLNIAGAQGGCAVSSCPVTGVIASIILSAGVLLGFIILLPVSAGARMTVHRSPLCRVC